MAEVYIETKICARLEFHVDGSTASMQHDGVVLPSHIGNSIFKK